MRAAHGDSESPYHDAETQSKRHPVQGGCGEDIAVWCVCSKAKFKRDAAAFVSVYSGDRIRDEVLSAPAAGRCQPLEAGGDGRLHPFDDLDPLRHDAERTLLAQSQVRIVISPVVGMPLDNDGIHVSLKRSAYQGGITGHHVGEEPVGLCRERAFPELEIQQIFRDDNSHQERVVRVFIHGKAELRNMLVE